jgi:hypothetical protein
MFLECREEESKIISISTLHAYSNLLCACIGCSIKTQVSLYTLNICTHPSENIIVYIQPEKLQNI